MSIQAVDTFILSHKSFKNLNFPRILDPFLFLFPSFFFFFDKFRSFQLDFDLNVSIQ